MGFVGGLMVGLFVGAGLGVLVMGVLAAGKSADIRREYERDEPDVNDGEDWMYSQDRHPRDGRHYDGPYRR
jgi:hypothetical protein